MMGTFQNYLILGLDFKRLEFQVYLVQVYCKISLYSTFLNLHCLQLAIASRDEQWLDVYTRENK